MKNIQRKVVLLLFSVMLLTVAATMTVTAEEFVETDFQLNDSLLLGDVNGDRKINTDDLVQIFQFIELSDSKLNKTNDLNVLIPIERINADLNGDMVISREDAVLLSDYLMDVQEKHIEFPASKKLTFAKTKDGIYISSNKKVIEKGDFADATYISFGSCVEEIKEGAFENSTVLQMVSFNSEDTIVGQKAFKNSSVEIAMDCPGSEITNECFSLCTELKRIKCVPTKIGEDAFLDCDKLDLFEYGRPKEELLKIEGLSELRKIKNINVSLDKSIEKLSNVQERKVSSNSAAYNIENVSGGSFKLTAYCACSICCGSYANGYTATGTKATAGRTIAVDPSVIPLGSTVNINGQTYIAEDTGVFGNKIDVYFDSHADAIIFGVKYTSDVSW